MTTTSRFVFIYKSSDGKISNAPIGNCITHCSLLLRMLWTTILFLLATKSLAYHLKNLVLSHRIGTDKILASIQYNVLCQINLCNVKIGKHF